MKRIINLEFYRAFRSIGFRLSVLCGMIVSFLDFCTFYKSFGMFSEDKVIAQAWIGLDYQFAYNSLFYLLMPLFASFAYSGSYFEDMRGGYIKCLIVKVSRKQYFSAKYIVSFITGAIAIAIPLVMNLMMSMAFFSTRLPEKLQFMHGGANTDIKLFSNIFNINTIVYCILFIVIDMVFAGCIAVFSICIADFTDNMFSTVTIPFSLTIISSVIFGDLEYLEKTESNLAIIKMINPVQDVVTSKTVIIIVPVLMILISFIWVYVKQRRKDII